MDHPEVKWLQCQIPPGDPVVDILHAVEPLEGSMVRAEGEWAPQQVIDRPPDGQALPFHGAVPGLPFGQLLADVQHRAVDARYLLVQDGPQPSARRISLQDKRDREVRGVEEGLPTEGLLYPLKRLLALLRPLDRIWGTLSGEVGQGAGQLRKVWNKSPVIAGQPQKPPHLLFVLGLGQAAIAAVLSTCGRTCPPPKWYPKYRTSLRPTAHFFGLAVSPACLSDSSSHLPHMLGPCSAHLSLWMITSSR